MCGCPHCALNHLAGGALWHATLVISAPLWSRVPRTPKFAFPTEEWCSCHLLPGCLSMPGLPSLCRLVLSCTQLPASAWEAEPRSGYIWQQLQQQTLILISGLFRLWLSRGTCLCKAHRFSLIWKTLCICVRLWTSISMQSFIAVFPLFHFYIEFKRHRSWEKKLVHRYRVSSNGRLWAFIQVACQEKKMPLAI